MRIFVESVFVTVPAMITLLRPKVFNDASFFHTRYLSGIIQIKLGKTVYHIGWSDSVSKKIECRNRNEY